MLWLDDGASYNGQVKDAIVKGQINEQANILVR